MAFTACLAECPLQESDDCLSACTRALQMAERARGTPLNVPFPAQPMVDLTTYIGPRLENWAAWPAPDAAPWLPVPIASCQSQCAESCALRSQVLTAQAQVTGEALRQETILLHGEPVAFPQGPP